MKLSEEKEWGAKFFLLGVEEAKFWFCLLGSVTYVWIWIVFNWRQKYLWILLFLNLAPNLSLCQEHQEGITKYRVCILGTREGKMMNESRISRVVVVVAIIFHSLGSLNVNV
jgi:1,4-dihydroxy-2-naphthoate octaprenyltransferase